MGSTESSEGRRVSFGVDEEERVRVLQGIRLSENVVNRMKDPCDDRQAPPGPAAPAAAARGPREAAPDGPHKESKLPPPSERIGGQPVPGTKDDLQRRKAEHVPVQDEPFQVAKRDKEATSKQTKASPRLGDRGVEAGKQRPPSKPPTELERRVAFHREQLGHVEKKNAEMYKVSSQQFHEAASKMETAVKPRGLEPVCSGLQAQILRCYGDHAREVLLCSELVKAYRRCVTVSVTHKG
ncbi:MICOS complex subunit MIC25 isoform X1 [Microcebus murinus]|uniref:MICOS complex subunit MIC25 isoform X1 n=1 Tax=Microcebus murinus TaxID=30608 RepID=UPI003F6B2DAC